MLITARGVMPNKDKFTILDVRTEQEWNGVHIDTAIHIPLDDLEERYAELPTDKPIVCVCKTGGRSQAAAEFLVEKGLEARNLEGGMMVWTQTELDNGLIDEEEFTRRIRLIK